MDEQGVGLPSRAVVAVVGAGTMGRGIASVAARAGHRVLLTDARPGAAAEALTDVADHLDRDVQRGRLSSTEAVKIAERIEIAGSLAELGEAHLVIEAVVEDMKAKREIFTTLDDVVGRDAILASNTSSLSIAGMASATERADRFAGLHFFNPATRMPLVEVVRTPQTSAETVAKLTATAGRWGKTPVVCTDTPGFIVNRVARPFYLEALAAIERDEVEPARLDSVIRGAGFPMGPCELLDLIGLDVNLAVSESVYDALDDEPRIRPSPLQRRLVAEGRLGRKSGHGFYTYPEGRPPVAPHPPGSFSSLKVAGDPGHGAGLVTRLAAAHDLDGQVAGDVDGLVVDGWLIEPAPGSARGAATFDVVADWALAATVGAAGDDAAVDAFAAVCATIGVDVIRMPPVARDVVLRTVAMIVAMAAEAAAAGVAEPADIDTAMRLGVNHPLGPFEWRDRLGAPMVDAALRSLAERDDAERYRPVGS